MFFNVVDAYTYKNYTDAITWPFIRLIIEVYFYGIINACQCLRCTNQMFVVTIKIPFVTSVVTSNSLACCSFA